MPGSFAAAFDVILHFEAVESHFCMKASVTLTVRRSPAKGAACLEGFMKTELVFPAAFRPRPSRTALENRAFFFHH